MTSGKEQDYIQILYLYCPNTKDCETRRPNITEEPIVISFIKSPEIEIIDIRTFGGNSKTC
jgi:hypothetical protein